MRRYLIYTISLKYLLTYLILMYILVKLSVAAAVQIRWN